VLLTLYYDTAQCEPHFNLTIKDCDTGTAKHIVRLGNVYTSKAGLEIGSPLKSMIVYIRVKVADIWAAE
jgi:hypothetical protein